MDRQKIVKYCQELLTTKDCTDLRLRDYSGQIWLVDELQKTVVIGGFIYIVNMTKSARLTNTKQYIKKTLEE